MRVLLLIFFLFGVADGRAESKPEGRLFSEDEQLAIAIYITKLNEEIRKLAGERDEAFTERAKMFERLQARGTCI